MKMKKPILILALGGALLLAALPARAQNPQTFTFQGNVFQTYTVPATGQTCEPRPHAVKTPPPII